MAERPFLKHVARIGSKLMQSLVKQHPALRPESAHFRKTVCSAGLVLWVMVVFGVYYAYHHFEIIPFKTALASWGANLLTMIGLVAVAAAWGRMGLRQLRVRTHSSLESLVHGVALGYGFVATIVLILGLVALLRPTVIWCVALVLALGALPELRRLFSEWSTLFRQLDLSRFIGWDFGAFLRLFLSGFLLMGLLLASVPPFSWDALVVHLLIPKNALQHGVISSENAHASVFTSRPILQHMLFTLGMGLRNDTMPKLIHFSFGVLTVLAIYSLARDHLNCSPLLAASFFYLIPVVQLVAPWAYVDLGAAFYTTTAIYALLNWLRDRGSRWALVAAACAVWAAQVKSTGFFVVVFAVLLVPYALLRPRRSWARRFAVFLQLVLAGLVVSLPWVAANCLLDAPALGGQTGSLPARLRSSLAAAQVQKPTIAQEVDNPGLADAAVPTLGASVVRYLALPWSMTMMGFEGRYEFDGELGPLFLLMLPMWPFVWRERTEHRVLISFALVGLLLWLATSGARLQNRLLMPVFPVVSAITACGVRKLERFTIPHLSPHRFARLVLIVVGCIVMVNQLIITSTCSPVPFIVGGSNRAEYLAHMFDRFYPNSPGYYEAMIHVRRLPPEARIGLLWPERRAYYVRRPYVVDPFGLKSSPEEMWGISQELGLTHLLVYRSGLEFRLHGSSDFRLGREAIAAHMEHLSVFLEEHGSLLRSEQKDYELYVLREP
jgi:4-amino-4-deoxy-L-arabinose transferase-like glycosyltransferase